MSPHLISIYALVAMFVVATILPINMGVIAFVGAFLIGPLAAGIQTKAIMTGFPAELFLTLVGITFLFAQAQSTQVAVAAQGPQIFGDSEGQNLTEEKLAMAGSPASILAVNPPASGPAMGPAGSAATDSSAQPESATLQQLATVAGLFALAVLTLAYKLVEDGHDRLRDPIGFIAAMAVSSTIVDVSPFSTNGALVLANVQGMDRDVFLPS